MLERVTKCVNGLLNVQVWLCKLCCLRFRQAFSKLTSAVRRSILKLMVLKTVEEDNTVIINNGEDVSKQFTMRPLLKDALNKGHNTFNLSIKDKFSGPYRAMAIQFYLLKRTTSV